jgi:hypothetical protein
MIFIDFTLESVSFRSKSEEGDKKESIDELKLTVE